MQIWNTKKLIERLRSGGIPEKEKAQYYVLTILAYTLLIEFQMWLPTEGLYTKLDFVSFAFVVVTTIAGTSMALKRNADNKDFITRVTCLTVPIALKLILVALLATVLASAALAYFGSWDSSEYPLPEQLSVLAITIFFQLVFYYRLIKGIYAINEGNIAE